MFKRPRKTICSDVRFTLEALHDRIYDRLNESERNNYLLQVAEFFSGIDEPDETTKGTTMHKFAQAMSSYLTDAESSKIITNLIDDDARNERCAECSATYFVYEKGFRTCDECGATVRCQDQTRAFLSYDDHRDIVQVYPYRRSNHFQEWLVQCQAKQSTPIPDAVYEQISTEMRKRRMDAHALTSTMLKSIMKSLRLNKYYEHIAYILCNITGKKPLTLSLEIEERMKQMFNEIQEPFDKVVHIVAPKRKNFLSYSFVLRKFAELMELDEIVDAFPLLKSREKLHVQDAIWKAICKELSWRFIPSL